MVFGTMPCKGGEEDEKGTVRSLGPVAITISSRLFFLFGKRKITMRTAAIPPVPLKLGLLPGSRM